MNIPSPLIGILQSKTGNTGSVERALRRLGISVRMVRTADEIAAVDGLIFPGAGAANAAMTDLRERGLVDVLRNYRRPFLGICLGMQLLFDSSEEGKTKCLGIIRGRVTELPENVMKPHMGWNRLDSGAYAYFVHSYVCEPADLRTVTMTVEHGGRICAAVRKANFLGLQWHPEKSGPVGDCYLLSFASLCR
ncbi:MAG: imidazole glycerol phosphate synthase subunit HisH [Candidatus Peribacteraceae bacterium]|nr:imidazole glycerol phosphate synthase subunit HisH [Candidatus Peribacteraceae bacterium]MDD5074953.1 imidazole glycerol phosphate synthase subunit HisH [Candidatus Peribacteraceae bacterium]